MDNADVKFYIPENETIPTKLRLYVDGVYVEYKQIQNGFRFYVLFDDENEAMKIAEKIIQQMKIEHDESEHGVSWRTVSVEIVPQDDRYKIDTIIDWIYRVRDSY